jgi:hypothetical protein
MASLQQYLASTPPPAILNNISVAQGISVQSLSVTLLISASNATKVTVTNGDPLKSPVCDFTNAQEFSYSDQIPWTLASGGAGERIVCLKVDGGEAVYRSVFYSPASPTTVQSSSTPTATFIRDINLERQMLPIVLPIFVKITGHLPNFSNPNEALAWNILIYNLMPFQRDLAKERIGISKFVSKFRHLPSTSLDWSVVRVLAYVF